MQVVDNDGNNLGVIKREEALRKAREVELDLVLVAPNAKPPVAKIIDWSKFKYEQSKKARQSKSAQVGNKEWWFKPNIEDRDMEIKIEQAEKFVQKGGVAKLTVKYVRRTPYPQMIETMKRLKEVAEQRFEVIGDERKEGRNIAINVKKK